LTSWTSLTVTWFDASDDYVTQSDITADVKAIPIFTDTGTEEINEATVVLIANNGDYITSTSPVAIDEFDRIRIEVTDIDGNEYDRVFEIITIKPSQSNNEGTLLELDCWGIEYYLNKVHYAKPHWFKDSFSVAEDIINVYNNNIRNDRQPDVSFHNSLYNPFTQHGNALPQWNINHYEYGTNEDTCFNRLNDLYYKLGASVAAGGVREFYETLYKTGDVNEYSVGFAVSGAGPADRNVSLSFIENSQAISVSEQEGGIGNPDGTNTLAWGSPVHGTLPLGHSKYASQEMQFRFRPAWVAGIDYIADAKVKHDGFHWKAKSDHTSSLGPNEPGGSALLWTIISKAGEYGSIFSYSEWTDDKALSWANAGSNPSAVTSAGSEVYNGNGAGMFDGNIVVNDDTEDEEFFRTWADVRIDDFTGLLVDTNGQLDAWAVTRSYDGTRNGFPRGFRVLVDMVAPTGDLLLRDENFKWHGQTVTEWNGENWVVKYSFDSNTDQMQVAVINEGKNYEWDAGASKFNLIANDYANTGNDCFHQYDTISNVDGWDATTVTNEGFTKNVKSAVEVKYTVSTFREPAANELYYKVGAWLCFAFPFPYTTDNGISEKVGEIYGGGGTTPVKEPATMDMNNMGFLSDGTVGFNQDKSEEYGPLSAVGFKIKFSDEIVAGVETGAIKGEDYPFSCFMVDINDNVYKQDFKVDFPKHWEDVELQLSGFSNYQGRTPYFVEAAHGNFANIIRPKDIEARNTMEWRNIRFMIIQYNGSYDEFGRYSPHTGGERTTLGNIAWNTGAMLSPGRTQTLTIDSLRFIKPLLARAAKIDGTDPNTPDRNMEADFLVKPNISTYDQLLSEAKSEQEIQKFKHKEYTLTTTGTTAFDILFGDSFYFQNGKLVSDADDGLSNTIKLVAKRIEYSITKPTAGNGGLRRRIVGIKRFT
jgi:hypothetical protein